MSRHWVVLGNLSPSTGVGATRRSLAPGHYGEENRCHMCALLREHAAEVEALRHRLHKAEGSYAAFRKERDAAKRQLSETIHGQIAGPWPPDIAQRLADSQILVDATSLPLLEATLFYVAAAKLLYGAATRPTVAVAAWRHDPVRWGLRGYETVSADAHLPSKYLTLLFQRGLLRKRTAGVYELTSSGREALQNLSASGQSSASQDQP